MVIVLKEGIQSSWPFKMQKFQFWNMMMPLMAFVQGQLELSVLYVVFYEST